MKNIHKRNNISITGHGKQTILFAHGFGCDKHVWNYIAPEFADKFRIVMFDYVGAGHSDLTAYHSSRYGSLQGYAHDILDICEDLNLQNVILVGHSVSSMISVLAAIEHPEYFEKLIFLGPSPRYLNDKGYVGGFEKKDLDDLFELMDSNYLGWSRALAPAIMGNKEKPELGERLTESFCATDPEIAREFARVTFFSDNRDDLPKLKIPSLTLQCSEDIIAPYSVGYYIKDNTKDNTLHIMKAMGHCPHMSAPEETVAAINSYLD